MEVFKCLRFYSNLFGDFCKTQIRRCPLVRKQLDPEPTLRSWVYTKEAARDGRFLG
jgi:hypothetical protein